MIKESIYHLSQNNMTYSQHFVFAFSRGLLCIGAGLCLIYHALIPGLFEKTGSTLISRLNKSFLDRSLKNS